MSQIKQIIKRDGRTVDFDSGKIAEAIYKAAEVLGGKDRDMANFLSKQVELYLTEICHNETPTVEQIQDAVEKILIENGHADMRIFVDRQRSGENGHVDHAGQNNLLRPGRIRNERNIAAGDSHRRNENVHDQQDLTDEHNHLVSPVVHGPDLLERIENLRHGFQTLSC